MRAARRGNGVGWRRAPRLARSARELTCRRLPRSARLPAPPTARPLRPRSVDFEQLKIENQTLNEKVEERNDEQMRLRAKLSASAHVLTHFKEKLQFIGAQNAGLKATLAEREVELVGKRDQLTSIKRARDGLRSDTAATKASRPLVNTEELLLDFERRKVRCRRAGERGTGQRVR